LPKRTWVSAGVSKTGFERSQLVSRRLTRGVPRRVHAKGHRRDGMADDGAFDMPDSPHAVVTTYQIPGLQRLT
jgi:hypothetical protein